MLVMLLTSTSMSLGGGVSTALDASVEQSIINGVVYAIAAGNNNGNACKYVSLLALIFYYFY
jgi:hypothetical protein